MATVTKWTPFGVALDITANGGTVTRTSATQFTVQISASWETYYDGAQTNYGMSATSGGTTKVISSFGTKRSSGSASFTGTYSISGNGAATKTITVTFKNYEENSQGSVTESATKNVTFNVSVPAWTSYTIKYNANGGSGIPGNQTKWKDQTLTLSSTKPTRTGYSFLGWSTSSTATTATYSAGGAYTANSAATLYAVWKANTYKVTYNANGGTGAPSAQTKTYGKALTLSSIAPTRTDYAFKGWATSASATTATYSAGGTYTANSAVTLYAVWELTYKKPEITNVVVERHDNEQLVSVAFNWKTYADAYDVEVLVSYEGGEEYYYPSWDTGSRSGSCSESIQYQCSDESALTVRIYVEDTTGGSWTVSKTLPGMIFAVDFLAGGKGVAFGKAAEIENVAEFGFDAQFSKPVYGKALGMDRLPAIPENSDLNSYLEPGCYAIYSNAIAATCENIPIGRAGRLEVWSATGEGVRAQQWSYLRQRFIPYNSGNAVWEREIARSEDDVWKYYEWWRSSLTPTASEYVYHEPTMLWGGDLTSGMYMTEGHTAELLEPISAQRHGIVLIFCAYNGTDDTNYGWQSFFVPKQLVALSTSGHTFNLCRGKFSYIGTKYLYIYDTYIAGHADNNLTGTSNGITYANNKFVLRYVLGI